MKLKPPAPYFGGKSRVADLVWSRLGDVDNLLVPFTGMAAVELGRPDNHRLAKYWRPVGVLLQREDPPKIETINDLDTYVSNFWRATQHDPEAVVNYADGPVNEVELHSRHRWLVLSEQAAQFRAKMRTDPDFYDPKFAGWWCWGLCAWIGGGWCKTPEQAKENRRPQIGGGDINYGQGVHKKGGKRPELSGNGIGTGVHRLPEQLPDISGYAGASGRGIHGSGIDRKLHTKRPCLGNGHNGAQRGVLAEGRPQLADAFSRGRGVHGNDAAGTCAERRAWLLDWFSALRDRLRTVRVCCGHWLRICDSDSVTTRLGMCGVFLDPPYRIHLQRGQRNRCGQLYADDSTHDVDKTVNEVIAYCIERGNHPLMRIVACCYEGEGYEVLDAHGWECVAWNAQGGYGNRSAVGRSNKKRERIWFSPHCQRQQGLF